MITTWWTELEKAFKGNWLFRVDWDQTDDAIWYANLYVRYRDEAIGLIEQAQDGFLVLIGGEDARVFKTPADIIPWLTRGPVGFPANPDHSSGYGVAS